MRWPVASWFACWGSQIEQMVFERRIQQIESQLADAIDLMVGALRGRRQRAGCAGKRLIGKSWPLRPQLEEVVGRIRLGDNSQTVFRELAARVPLETFLLFTSALSVHWEVGGNLAPTLSTVGPDDTRPHRTFAPHPLDDRAVASVDHRDPLHHVFHRAGDVAERSAPHGGVSVDFDRRHPGGGGRFHASHGNCLVCGDQSR